jgi:hypothetical protein
MGQGRMTDLSKLGMSAVFLLDEFFSSGIEPIAARVRKLRTEEDRHDFYVALLPHLIAHCREQGLPHPHETALFLVRIVMFRL